VTTPLVYVYAVLAERRGGGTLQGIDGAVVDYVTEGGLSAAVSKVRPEDFDEEPLNERVRDMSWLAPRAVAHQEVNYRLHGMAAAMLPLSFGTVFRDEARVRDMLRTNAAALQGRLARVQGAAEWVVTLHLVSEPDPEAVAERSPAIRAARAEIAAANPGRAHLLRRGLAELEREEARREQAEAADNVLASLRTVSRGVFQEPLPTDAVERPLVRASLLVARASEEAFLADLERLRQRFAEPTYRLVLTGPWPPYRFGGLETEADG
jgi:hypothetical protein